MQSTSLAASPSSTAVPMPPAEETQERVASTRRRLLNMGEAVRAMVEQALAAVSERTARGARSTFGALDRAVDREEMEIDRAAHALLCDGGLDTASLRVVVGALKSTTDLERIGDEAVKLAHVGLALADFHLTAERRAIAALGAPVLAMVADALRALETLDVALAEDVIARDDDVDLAYRRQAEGLRAQMCADPTSLEQLVQVRFAAKCLERIGDHATNLAEQAVFVATGADVRHRWGKRVVDAERRP